MNKKKFHTKSDNQEFQKPTYASGLRKQVKLTSDET